MNRTPLILTFCYFLLQIIILSGISLFGNDYDDIMGHEEEEEEDHEKEC